ncbi:MAG: hypothetical protein EOM47_00005 [Bacteroidia bacterium]|nr:hypothetical protein [Bacteroidia bacterium]
MLSKLYFSAERNSTSLSLASSSFVVICFQNCILAPKETAKKIIEGQAYCCDLLSKLYFSAERNSCALFFLPDCIVVICFQNCILAPKETAWAQVPKVDFGCDLLSKLYFSAERNSLLRSDNQN